MLRRWSHSPCPQHHRELPTPSPRTFRRGIGASVKQIEVLVQMMALELDGGATPLESMQNTLQHLRSTWGLCISSETTIAHLPGGSHHHRSRENETFVSSDPHPLTACLLVYLEDGDLAVIEGSFSITTKGRKVKPNITVLEEAWGEADLGDASLIQGNLRAARCFATVHRRSC